MADRLYLLTAYAIAAGAYLYLTAIASLPH